MITALDVQALIELLQRTPMSKAERLFAGRFINDLVSTVKETPDEGETNLGRSGSSGGSFGMDHRTGSPSAESDVPARDKSTPGVDTHNST